MTLTDPRDALATQSTFIGYLMGLVGLGRIVHALVADGDNQTEPSVDSDDFVHLLLGVASLGASIEQLVESVPPQPDCDTRAPSAEPATTRWLR